MPIEYTHDHENEITLFAETNFRNAKRRFGIKTDDRRRHVYILGKTGMGKTTLIENMVLSDIVSGHGVCYVDPHGDTAEKLLDFIPSSRINDVVYFNPSDMDFPVGFNILETVDDDKKHLVASGLMGVFKKIWPDVWSPRMEYILLNCVLALLDYPGATLLGINRLLVDKEYRKRVIAKLRDPIVKTFWVAEFTSWSEKYATEAIAPVQNKVGQFLSASIIRNIVSQVKSTIDLRRVMDDGKILIVNLSKGKIGEDNMRLLGGMLITKLQMAAMERVDIPKEADRRDFYLFVDEFQNFANQSFASILSEARKYRLNLIVAHQYIKQLEEEVCWGVFGNVGTIITFRVGADDATFMENEFMPTFTPEDLVNLSKFEVYMKLMVDGAATPPFSAHTLAPIETRTHSTAKVIAVSRERYGAPRAMIEEKVLRWSGMETGEPGAVQYPEILTEDEQGARENSEGSSGSFMDGERREPRSNLVPLTGGPNAEEQAENDETSEFLRITPERLEAISKPPQPGMGKKDKPKFPHTCTRCGKTWDMPIQLDTSRPIYCAECLPLVREERKSKTGVMKSVMRGETSSRQGEIVVEDVVPASKSEAKLADAFFSIDKGTPREPRPSPSARPSLPPRPMQNSRGQNAPRVTGERPRLPPRPGLGNPSVQTPPARGTVKIISREAQEPRESLLDELQRAKGKPIEKNKDRLTSDGSSERRETTEDRRQTDDRRQMTGDRREAPKPLLSPTGERRTPTLRPIAPVPSLHMSEPAAPRMSVTPPPPAPPSAPPRPAITTMHDAPVSPTVFRPTTSSVRVVPPPASQSASEDRGEDGGAPSQKTAAPGQRITF